MRQFCSKVKNDIYAADWLVSRWLLHFARFIKRLLGLLTVSWGGAIWRSWRRTTTFCRCWRRTTTFCRLITAAAFNYFIATADFKFFVTASSTFWLFWDFTQVRNLLVSKHLERTLKWIMWLSNRKLLLFLQWVKSSSLLTTWWREAVDATYTHLLSINHRWGLIVINVTGWRFFIAWWLILPIFLVLRVAIGFTTRIEIGETK